MFDASALLAFIREEPGAEEIRNILLSGEHECLIHAANLYEVFRDILHRHGEPLARGIIRDLQEHGLAARMDLDEPFWTDAALLRERFRMSMADAFGLTLAARLGAEFLTADHHELDPVAAAGAARIRFFR